MLLPVASGTWGEQTFQYLSAFRHKHRDGHKVSVHLVVRLKLKLLHVKMNEARKKSQLINEIVFMNQFLEHVPSSP